jgi:hypothetical protein
MAMSADSDGLDQFEEGNANLPRWPFHRGAGAGISTERSEAPNKYLTKNSGKIYAVPFACVLVEYWWAPPSLSPR